MNYKALDVALAYLNNGIIIESTLNKSPEELSQWMKKNIKYKNFTTLMSHDDVLSQKAGSCHDQVMFELKELAAFHPKAMFCIETNKKQGGVTHSFVYFNRNGKICWFENAWSNMAGVHEFDSLKKLKDFIKENYQGNKEKFPDIEFAPFKGHKPGETLQELVDKCFKSSINESKDASELDKNFKKKSDLHFKILDMKSTAANKYVPKEWKEDFNYKAKDAAIAVCREDDQLVGFIYWNSKSGTIGPLKVYKEYRGYGISELLLKTAIDGGGRKLGVYSDNEVALNLYKKMGFKEVERKEYADGDVAIMMELDKK